MFKKASKKKAKLRCAIFGPSGAGKTYTILRIAKGMGGKTAAIDTECGSMSKYASVFNFDVLELKDKTIQGYVEAINMAGEAGYNNLLIDSLSHAWQELLEKIDKLAKTKYRGNTWSAWSEGTPEQKLLINAILSYPGHVFATMRSKTEWTTEKTSNGKNAPVRVGLAPEQGKSIEYEFDMLLEMNTDHYCNVIKDRTGKFQDKIIEKPDESFGKELVAWLNEGEEPLPEKPLRTEADVIEDVTEVLTTDVREAAKLIERIGEIGNVYEAKNWREKHKEEVNKLMLDDKNRVVKAYKDKLTELEKENK